MKHIVMLFWVVLIPLFSNGQIVRLPKLQEVEKFKNIPHSVALQVFFDDKKQITYQVGEESSTNLDALTQMLTKPLESFSTEILKKKSIRVILSADESIPMSQMELLLQELVRLGLSKIIFNAEPEGQQLSNNEEINGIAYQHNGLNYRDLKVFYAERNMPFRKYKSIPKAIIEKRRRELERLNPDAAPPYPEPEVEEMMATSESTMKRYPEAKVINIEIGNKKKIKVNGKKIKLNDLNKLLIEEVNKGKCIFIVTTKRNTSYAKYLKGISAVLLLKPTIREIYAQKNHNQSYDRLNWRVKRQVNRKVRLLFFSKMVD